MALGGRDMRKILGLLLLTLLTLRPASSFALRCLDDAVDATQIGAARLAIAAACPCFRYDGTSQKKHSNYTACARGVVDSRVAGTTLRRDCKGNVLDFYSDSVCGFPASEIAAAGPQAICLSSSIASGKISCEHKPVYSCLTTPTVSRRVCYGSTTCIDGADTNQDLRIGKDDSGVCTPGASYLDNGDGTITDLESGLVWEKKDDAGGLHDWDSTYAWGSNVGGIFSWVSQINAEGGVGFAGHADWRIPTAGELQTLLRFTGTPSTAAEFAMVGYAPGCTLISCSLTATSQKYWSASAVSNKAALAWAIAFGPGLSHVADTKTGLGYVRAVRGGM